jgi:hypothetical protein
MDYNRSVWFVQNTILIVNIVTIIGQFNLSTILLTNSPKQATTHNTMFMITKAVESALSLNLTNKCKAKETTCLGFCFYLRWWQCRHRGSSVRNWEFGLCHPTLRCWIVGGCWVDSGFDTEFACCLCCFRWGCGYQCVEFCFVVEKKEMTAVVYATTVLGT